jgi:hypothetical protein
VSTTVSFETAFPEADALVRAIKEELIAELPRLPDNPRINRINRSCYTINFSDLGASWSAEYYDFKRQYQRIIEWLRLRDSLGVLERLKEQLASGYLRFEQTRWKLHPEVIEHVRKLLKRRRRSKRKDG